MAGWKERKKQFLLSRSSSLFGVCLSLCVLLTSSPGTAVEMPLRLDVKVGGGLLYGVLQLEHVLLLSPEEAPGTV